MGSDFRTVSGVYNRTAALNTEKLHPTKFTILTILQGVERRVAFPAVGLPSPSGQDLFLVYFGIPLCYPPYTHRTATCAPPPCRHVDRHVLTPRPCSLLWPPWNLARLQFPGFFSLFLRPTLGIRTFLCHLYEGCAISKNSLVLNS